MLFLLIHKLLSLLVLRCLLHSRTHYSIITLLRILHLFLILFCSDISQIFSVLWTGKAKECLFSHQICPNELATCPPSIAGWWLRSLTLYHWFRIRQFLLIFGLLLNSSHCSHFQTLNYFHFLCCPKHRVRQ